MPGKCTECSGEIIRFSGFGTQKLEEETQSLFPKARIKRMDRDTMKTRASFENVYTEMVQQMSANSTAAFTTKRYERGWLSSSAETTIQMPRVPFGFRLTSEIEHGPIAINRILQGELQLKPALAFVVAGA